MRFPWSRFWKDDELKREIQSHLELAARDRLDRGEAADKATHSVHREFGNVDLVREVTRHQWGGRWLENLFQDLRFGLRMLGKYPGFTAVALLVLALGIGANTAIFSVVNAVLLRPLPFHDPGQLFLVWHVPPQKSFPGTSTFSVSPANYLDWQKQNHVFDKMAALGLRRFNLSGRGEPESVAGSKVAADFFTLLGVQADLGRTFISEDDQPGHGNVVVVSYAFWQSHFGGNPNILGQTLRLDNRSYAVIGVMPPKFEFPFQTQLWAPLAWSDKDRAVRGIHNYIVMARLKTGVDVKKAQAELDTISSRLAQQYPTDNAGWGAVVLPLRDQLVGQVQPALLVLLGAVAFVLLIACTNVANLTLAKALGRRKEIAIRTALGAGRGRVLRQVLSETVLLSLLGGALALALAHYGVVAIASFLSGQLPLSVEIGLDIWVLAFTLGISILTGIIAGVTPAWHLTKTNLNDSLKEGLGRTDTVSGGRMRSVLVVSQIALSLVLLIGAGLMIRTLWLLRAVDPGFDPHNVLTMPLAISETKYPKISQQTAFFNTVLERVRGLPGLETVGQIDYLPLQGGSTQPVAVEGQPVVPMADQPEVAVRLITPGYLRALRIPLLEGRDFTDADKADSQRVLLVSESFARRFWPKQDPIGKQVTLTFYPGVLREVVGVVGDVKQNGLDVTRTVETVYHPMAQNPETTRMVLAVRTASRPTSLVSAVTRAVHEVDPDEPIVNVATMDDIVNQSLLQQRLSMFLLAAFAGLALLLAAVGIYGVQSYAVRQRVQEIGIRMTLGAQQGDVFRLIVGQGLKLAVVGIGIGLAAAFALTRLMARLLFGLSATDPLTFGGVAFLLMIIAVMACYLPARRATRVDPLVALRYE
ncbi:MAG: ABC transporter permease [Acidobacteriia bacterium]|nr:ABC transporter permease [Terriglobia bacterium]